MIREHVYLHMVIDMKGGLKMENFMDMEYLDMKMTIYIGGFKDGKCDGAGLREYADGKT